MANTIASMICADFIIEGTPIYKKGMLAGAYSPCTVVYQSAAGVWTAYDADEAGHIIMKYGIVGYKERILSTGAASTIDSAYATTDTAVPILVGFVDGYGEFVCFITDPAATILQNALFVASSTAGTLQTGAGVTAALAAGDPITGITNVETLVTGDLYMHARWESP